MPHTNFDAILHRPAQMDEDCSWTFLLLPKAVSDTLPRRGRITVYCTINSHSFQATLEPDGQLSHWMKVGKKVQEAANATAGDSVTVQLSPLESELEPELPTDFEQALLAVPDANRTWQSTTVIGSVGLDTLD